MCIPAAGGACEEGIRDETAKNVQRAELLFPFQSPLGPSCCSGAGVPKWAGVPLAAGFPGRSRDEDRGLGLYFLTLPHAPLPARLHVVARVMSSMLISLARQVGVGCRLSVRSGGGPVTAAVSPVLRPLEGRPGLLLRACLTGQACGAGLPAHLRQEPPSLSLSFLTGSPLSSAPSHLSLPVSSPSPHCFSGRSGDVVSGHV